VNFTIGEVSCYQGNDGSLDISVAGGTGPYDFVWSNGAITEDINGLLAQYYTVEITDANNCVLIDSAFVFEPNELTTSSEATTATSDGSNGRAWTIPVGGTAPYSFMWNDPLLQEDDTATGLIIGGYNVLITDAKGCIVRDSVWVAIAPEPSLINMFPNPTTGEVTITNLDALGLEENILIEIIQMQGKLEQSFEVVGLSEYKFRLDNNLFNGAYLIRISNFRGSETRKLILIR